MQKCFDTRKKSIETLREGKLGVFKIILSVSKHFKYLKLNRSGLRPKSIVSRTWFSTAWPIEF